MELFIIIVLIILVLVSCCGLLQKIRKSYEENPGHVISVTQISVPNSNIYQPDAYSNSVFPAQFSPPPYLEYMDPPPKYEDLIKQNQIGIELVENQPTRNAPSRVTNTQQSLV